jgi:hypothetical protein
MRVFLTLLLMLIICLPVLTGFSFVRAQQSDAQSDISDAQSNIITCFNTSKLAESAGANISKLTATLNTAGLLLSQAELAYSNGDFGTAQDLAVQSQNVLVNFISESNSLQTAATQNRNTDFMIFVGSIGSTVAVLVGSVVIWVFLRRKFRNSEVGKS